MKQAKHIIAAALIAAALPAGAQVSASPERFSPQAAGYMERARSMREAGNFAGVIDQLRHLATQGATLTPEQAEEYTFLLAEAYYERDDAECLRLLLEFRDTYPASPLAPEAGLAIGDFHFFRHDWPDALEAYNAVDLDRLNRDRKALYSYRKALSMIRTGHFAEARPLVRSLRGAAGYTDTYEFYNAYLDYIDGNFDKAWRGFEKVKPGIPGLDAGYYMAQIEYTRRDYKGVISRGTALLRNQPDPELRPELQRIVGLSLFKTGDSEAAREYLNGYLENTQGTPEADAIYAMGAIEYADGAYASASERFSSITDRNDAIGQSAWLYLGQCYLRRDNPTSAAMAFEKANRMPYDREVSETALYNYVTALTRGGKVPFSSSSELLETFVKRYPDSEYTPEVEAYLATAYYNDRDYKKALQSIDAIRNPSDRMLAARQKILYELGIEAATNGHTEEAAGYLRQCVNLRQHNRDLAAQASLWLGDALFALGRYGEAQKAYETFVKDDATRTNRALGLYDLGYAKYKQGNYKGAASDFEKALAARPALPRQLADDARIRRADCLYYTGRYSDSSALYSQAVEAGATDADYALYRRAVLRGLAGDTRGKLEDLTRAEREYPSSRWMSKILLEQALTYEETGHADKAADAYKKRLGVSESVDIDELLRMAAAMSQADRPADLLEVVERIRHAGGLEADELAEIDMYEADGLTALGRGTEAEPIYTALAQNPTSLPGSKAAVALAEEDIRQGRLDSARDRMEEFTETGTPHQYWLARGFIALADAYRGLGETSLAREYLESLKENYPGGEKDIETMISSRLKKWK